MKFANANNLDRKFGGSPHHSFCDPDQQILEG
jgi:hypothetical protein